MQSMRRWSWLAAAAVGAVALVSYGGPARARPAPLPGPSAAAPRARAVPAEERRLAADIERLRRAWKHREALPLAERLVALREAALDPEHPDLAEALHILGSLYRSRYAYDRALPLLERALETRRRRHGEGSPEVASSLLELGAIHRDQSRFALAVPALERALAIREARLGADHPDVAEALYELGRQRKRTGAFAEARAMLARAISIWDKVLGPGSVNAAQARAELAVVYQFFGPLEEQRGLTRPLEEVHAVFVNKLGPEHLAVAQALAMRGWSEYQHRDLDACERSLEAALEAFRKELGDSPNPLWVSWAPLLADMYIHGGRRAEALAVINRLRDLCSDPRTSDPLDCSIVDVVHGLYYQFIGDYAQADLAFRQALRVQIDAGGAEHPHAINTLDLIGQLHLVRSDCKVAGVLLQRVLASSLYSASDGIMSRAVTEMMLGRAHHGCRDLASAEASFRQSLASAESSTNPGARTLIPFIHLNMSATRMARGSVAEAGEILERARAAAAEQAIPRDFFTAFQVQALVLQTRLYAYQGDAHASLPAARSAAEYAERRWGSDSPRVWNPLHALAQSLLLQGRVEESLDVAVRAARIQDRQASILLPAGAEEERRAFMASLRDSTDLAIHLHARAGAAHERAARLALEVVLRRKARVLDAMADTFASLRARSSPENQILLDRLRDLQRSLAASYARGPGALSRNEHDAQLRALDEERRDVEAELSRRNHSFSEEQRLVTIEGVQAALPEGAALVEIVVHRPLNEQARSPAEHWHEPRYAAYLLRPRGGVLFHDLGPTAPIDAAVLRLRRALADPSSDPAAPSLDLARRVLHPLLRDIGDASQLLVSPDGALSLIPFEALRDEAGQYLIESRAVSYLTSGRDLVRLRAPVKAAPRGGPVIVAAPAFGPIDATGEPDGHRGRRSANVRDLRFPALPETAEEARAIQQHLPGARVVMGADATEATLKALAAPEVLHVATHGFFLPREHQSPVDLASAWNDPEVASAAELQVENRLLRSGLALAGANPRRSGEEDGLLTALEVSGLNLHGTKLVVLSACESGIGEVTHGEGVSGLRRALALAGAETQVMSLWRVDDEVTRQLMAGYYAGLRAGAGRSQALRNVALAIRGAEETAHPYYWAAFITSGSWATLDDQWPAPPVAAVAHTARVPPRAGACACAVPGGVDAGARPFGASEVALAVGWLLRARRRRVTSTMHVDSGGR